jgi:hypothetical protein
VKFDNWTWRPRYHRKWVWKREPWKLEPTHSVPLKTSLGAQNLKIGPDAHVTAKMSPGARNLKTRSAPSIPSKISSKLRNLKTWRDAPSIVEKDSISAKDLDFVEKESGAQNVKNRMQHPLYRKKWVRGHVTQKHDSAPSVLLKMILGVKILKPDPTPTVTPKTSSIGWNLKTGLYALGISKNESRGAKLENWT